MIAGSHKSDRITYFYGRSENFRDVRSENADVIRTGTKIRITILSEAHGRASGRNRRDDGCEIRISIVGMDAEGSNTGAHRFGTEFFQFTRPIRKSRTVSARTFLPQHPPPHTSHVGIIGQWHRVNRMVP